MTGRKGIPTLGYPSISAAARDLRDQGLTWAAVGRRLGCTASQAAGYASGGLRETEQRRYKAAAAAGDGEAQVRACLRCGHGFPSLWKGNRICIACTAANKRHA